MTTVAIPMDLNVEILSDVAVSPNLYAKDRGTTTFCPTMCLLADGSVICSYRHGKEKHSRDGVLLCQKSLDGGRTWLEPTVIYDGMMSANPISVHTGAMCVLNDHSLLAVFTAVEARETDAYIFSEVGRSLAQQFFVARSEDGGATWTDAEIKPIPNVPYNFYIGCQPIVLRDGTVFLPIEVTLPGGVEVVLGTASTDQGKTWQPVWNCMADEAEKIAYGDPRLAVLRDGRLVMLAWTWQIEGELPMPVYRSISHDQGRSWSAPASTNVASQIMNPLALDAENLLAISNVRTKPEGSRLWRSVDAGETWNADSPLQMWDPYVQRILGEPLTTAAVETDALRQSLWDSLPGFTFGTPELLELHENEFLLMYYGTVQGVTHVRACRFRLK